MNISINIFPKIDPRQQESQNGLYQSEHSQGGGYCQNGVKVQIGESAQNGVNTQTSGSMQSTNIFQTENHFGSPEDYCQRAGAMFDRNNPRTLPVPNLGLSCALNDPEFSAIWDEITNEPTTGVLSYPAQESLASLTLPDIDLNSTVDHPTFDDIWDEVMDTTTLEALFFPPQNLLEDAPQNIANPNPSTVEPGIQQGGQTQNDRPTRPWEL
ncbi:hypothetical protein NHQ30_004271 [Ciborinia camelliae]|nr:hypothetical protein NHQ30_004271 [Ciborinia camelliae]